jgi:hypothetical protein
VETGEAPLSLFVKKIAVSGINQIKRKKGISRR